MLFKNFSSIQFDQSTEKLIQRGSTFVPLPKSVNRTETQAALQRFERNCLWKAHFYTDEDQEDTYIPPLFKKVKDNLPSKAPPKPLEDALTGIRTEILSAKLNPVHDNISKQEREAIKNLVENQNKVILSFNLWTKLEDWQYLTELIMLKGWWRS